MAINRFDTRPNNYDFGFNRAIEQLPQVNWDMLDQMMGNQQEIINSTASLGKQMPNVLNTEEDKRLFQEYKTFVDTGLKGITDAYSQGLKAGNSAQNAFKQQLVDEWTPGGRADVLNKRYENYQKTVKELEDFYKTDKRGVNKFLSLKQLEEDLKNPIGYNPLTRTAKTGFNADKTNDPDVRDAVDKMLKEIHENGDTQFIGNTNKDYWITKIKTAERDEDRIKYAFDALAEQPEFQAQIKRDARYQIYNTDENTYKKEFDRQLDTGIANIKSLSNKAPQSKQQTIEWQQMLNSQGYNVAVDGDFGEKTKKATEQFIKEKEKEVEERKNSFDFSQEVFKDTRKTYEDYALRGAYKKVDKDLIYNRALIDRAKLAQARRANDIAEKRLELEFAPKDNSDIFVGSGKVQSLPAFLDYTKEVNTNANNAKQNFETALKGSIFNGWKPEYIAKAYQLWEQSNGDRKQFESLLRQNSDFPFDQQQLDGLYSEFMLPQTESGVKTLMDNYYQTTEEANNLNKAVQGVSQEYINTPEGKTSLGVIQQFRKAGETDEQLVQRALSNPEDFTTFSYNPTNIGGNTNMRKNAAEEFKSRMKADIDKQSKQGKTYNWNNLGTYEIYAGKSDKTVKPVLDNMMTFIRNSDGVNLSSFGSIGLKVTDSDGNLLEPQSVDIDRYGVAKDEKGNTIIKMSGTAKLNDKSTKGFTSRVEVIPGSPEAIQIKRGLEAAYTTKFQAGEKDEAEAILDIIHSMNGESGVKHASRDILISNLTNDNTQKENIIMKYNDKFININDIGWRVTKLGTERVGGIDYTQVGILTPDGGKHTGLVGTNGSDMFLIPNEKDESIFSRSSSLFNMTLQKDILSKQPIQVTETKK